MRRMLFVALVLCLSLVGYAVAATTDQPSVQTQTFTNVVTFTVPTVTVTETVATTPTPYPGLVADGELSDFDHVNEVNGATIRAENGYYRTNSGSLGGYSRGVWPVSFAGDGTSLWYGTDVFLPADFYSRLTDWVDGPVRLVNWFTFRDKDNAGTSFSFWRTGGEKNLILATWRDSLIAQKVTHAPGPRLAVGHWHRIDVFHRFSSTSPVSELWLNDVLVARSTARNYGWDRPFVMNLMQCGGVATDRTPNLTLMIDNCYIGAERLSAGRR